VTSTPPDQACFRLISKVEILTYTIIDNIKTYINDLTLGKAKWDAWNSNKGTSKEDAEKKYIVKVNELVAKHGLNA
jgi:acyl-CoA-binding protein